MNKTRIIVVCSIALCIAQKAQCSLMVLELVPGQTITYDDVTGYYWYRNLPYFTNMTYAQQITAIAGLGTFGNISGGWHMATVEDIESLAANPGQSIVDTFLRTEAPGTPPVHRSLEW